MTKLLSRDAILTVDDFAFEDVEVPEWGGVVRVGCMSAYEKSRYEESLIIGKGKKRQTSLLNARARLVALCIIDEDGKRLFSETDIQALGSKNAGAMERVANVAMRLNGFTDDDMDDLTENFGNGHPVDSPSD